MPQVIVRGIPVDFPKEPYPCQVNYMSKVVEALETRRNALLESPTGTGKTLCLLCATLAWQKHRYPSTASAIAQNAMASSGAMLSLGVGASVKQHRTPNNSNNSSNSNSKDQSAVPAKPSTPMIIYATRTHSQLAQVVSELGETAYRPRMTVLGSRDQLCVHERVSKLRGSVLTHSCNALGARHGCNYKNNVENTLQFGSISGAESIDKEVLDIEDLVKSGKRNKVCPYFYTREISQSAQIVLLPYNYLLDSSIRKTLKVNWQNAIVIFDEAHNLERVASDAASCEISTADLAACIEELQQVVSLLRDQGGDNNNDQNEGEDRAGFKSKSASDMMGSVVQKPDFKAAVALLRSMFNLEQRIDAIPLHREPNSDQGPCAFLPGTNFLRLFEESGFLTNDAEYLAEQVRMCSNMLMEEAQRALDVGDSVLGGGAAPAHATEPKLSIFASTFERVLRAVRGDPNDYRLYVNEEKLKQFNANRSDTVVMPGNKVATKRVLKFWCFSTGVALSELVALDIRSVIVTSGTLSPLSAMKEDLRIPFPVELVNPHVIGDKQVFIATVSTGARGKVLNSSFNNRDVDDYKDELGYSILSIYRSLRDADSAVKRESPEASALGGVLVFFPGYAAMDNVVARWKAKGIFDTLRHEIGSIVVESRGAAKTKVVKSDGAFGKAPKGKSNTTFHFGGAAEPTKASQRSEEDAEEDQLATVVQEFESAIKIYKRCLLLAVCRGKVSEGIDFSNNKGRVVIVTGIPFAPYMDPWVVMKKNYLDEKASRIVPTTASASLTVTAQSTNIGANANTNSWAQARQSVMPTAAPTTTVVATTAPMGTRAGGISGQAWYKQSASRAVNQCLGRVIRHKNDWGAIFLLDQRFQGEDQLSQLSAWMRPRVKKFPALNDTSSAFNSFLVGIARDPTLRYIERAPEVAPSLVPRKALAQQDNTFNDPIQRIVEISEDELAKDGKDAEEGESFLDPSLLNTQNVTTIARTSSSSSGTVSSAPIFPLFQQREKKPISNLVDRLMNRDGPLSSRAQPLANKSSLSSKTDSASSSSGFGLSSADLSQRFTSSNTSSNSAKTESFADSGPSLSQSQSFSLSQSFSQSQSQSQPSSNPVTVASFSRKAMLSTNISPAERENAIKALWHKLKPHIDVPTQKEFAQLIRTTKAAGGPQSTSQVREFVSELCKILKNIPDELRKEVVLGLQVMLDNKALATVYANEANTQFSMSALTGKRKLTVPAAPPAVGASSSSQSMPPPPPMSVARPLSLSRSALPEEDLSKVGTKRAKLLLQLANRNPTVSTPSSTAVNSQRQEQQSSLLSQLREWSKVEEISKPGEINAKALVDGGMSNARLKCIICADTAKDACAARCGHICCQECWVKWLRTKEICPMCRGPASTSTITRVRVKGKN